MKEEGKYISTSAQKNTGPTAVDYKEKATQTKLSHYCPYNPGKARFGASILDKLFS